MIRLSVIIPTRNRAELLFTTLASIEKQTLDQSFFEVIVCDNNSTDNSAEIARSFADKFQHFRYIKTIEPGLHVGRNKGFLEAQGDILVYVDDDIEAFPEWLSTINEVFKDKDVALVGGKNLPKWEIDPPDWAIEMWMPNENGERILWSFSIIDLGDRKKEINPFYVFGCNFSVRKKIIEETKGFHPDGMPQEIIEFRGDGESFISRYIQQKGYKTIYHPQASVFHLVSSDRLTINYLRKRGFNQGVSDSYTNIRNQKPFTPKKSISLKSLLIKVLRRLLKLLKDKPKETIREDTIYYKAMYEGHKEGFGFHQQKVKENPELKAWVMKDNYL